MIPRISLFAVCLLFVAFSRSAFSSACGTYLQENAPLDLRALPNNVLVRKTSPLFTEEEAQAVIRSLYYRKDIRAGNLGNGLTLQLPDVFEILLAPEDIHHFSYPDVEKLLGKNAYSKLVAYFQEVVGLIAASKGLAVDRALCVVRTFSRKGIIIREISPGKFVGGHRHQLDSYLRRDPDYKYEEIDAAKIEWGPGTVAVGSDGKAVVGDRDHTLFFSNALHGSPDYSGDRLLIIITVRTKEPHPQKKRRSRAERTRFP